MSDMLSRIQAFNTAKREQFGRVMRCEESPPACFTCAMLARRGGPDPRLATHVSARITPAGYHAWQCDSHLPRAPEKPWGSDPGWPTVYVPIAEARSAVAAKGRR